jgi:type I restriction enzyme, R subunit
MLSDQEISANNYRYFGDPVYEYDISQGIEDGYLAACEIFKGRVNIDDTGLSAEDVFKLKPKHAITGKYLTLPELKEIYEKNDFENKLLLPDRIDAMCKDLFNYLCENGEPEQKTIIFCTRDIHCVMVSAKLEELYIKYCKKNNREVKEHFSFVCTQKSKGGDKIPIFKGNQKKYFIATTVDLLSTGVDIPCIQNIVFFRYLNSAITFYQMVGRGTRLNPETGKLMFRIYDYTNSTRLFGHDFITKIQVKQIPGEDDGDENGDPPEPPPPPSKPIAITTLQLDDIHVTRDGELMLVSENGKPITITVDEYKRRLVVSVIENAKNMDDPRNTWIVREDRKKFIESLPSFGKSAVIVQQLDKMQEYDLYDVLIHSAYTEEQYYKRNVRVEKFLDESAKWLNAFIQPARSVIVAIAKQFAIEGTDGLENQYLFKVTDIANAGGLLALKETGQKPFDILQEAKRRLFGV